MKETKRYPLTMPQYLIHYQSKFVPKATYIGSVIDLLDEVDEKKLLQAMYLAIVRTPSASVRICMVDKKPMQYFSDASPEGVEIIDMTDKTDDECSALFEKWSRTPFPNKGFDTQLYNLKLIRRSNGRHSIFLRVSHYIFDAYSLMALIKYISDVYGAINAEKPLPKEPYSPLAAYEADFKYMQSERRENDRKWWLEKQFATEPQFTTMRGLGAPEFKQGGPRMGMNTPKPFFFKTLHENLRIPAEKVEKFQNAALEWKVSPQSLYLLAIRTYLGAVCDTEDVTVLNTVARRATLTQKRAGGTMVNGVPFRTIISNDSSFREACDELYRAQLELYRYANISTGELLGIMRNRFNVPSGAGYHTISFTFQPYFNAGDDGFRYRFTRINNGVSAMPLYLSIMPFDGSGDLWANYEYQTHYNSPELIGKFHKFMLEFLDRGIDEPEMTIKSLTDMLIK